MSCRHIPIEEHSLRRFQELFPYFTLPSSDFFRTGFASDQPDKAGVKNSSAAAGSDKAQKADISSWNGIETIEVKEYTDFLIRMRYSWQTVMTYTSFFRRAKEKAWVSKRATFHTLRHSYAMHLLEMGTDVRLIKKLLEHSDIKTTLQYTPVSKRTLMSVRSAG